jgi:pimeloyl-ACP methyl ester carboxylesterase
MSGPIIKSFKALAGDSYIDISYREHGDPKNSRVAICVHGLSRNAKDFDDLAAALSSDWRVIAVDMPGRGASGWLANKDLYGYPLYEHVCAAAIAASGAESVTWIGTSMGGILGMRLAAKRAAPIDRLVLNDIGPFIPAEGRRDNQANFGKDPRFATEAEAMAYVRETRSVFGPFTEEDWTKFCRESLRQLDDGQWTLHYDPGLASNAPITDTDNWALWPLIRVPVLTLWGVESKLLTASTVDRMAKSGPRSAIYAVEGAGHCPGLTRPDQIDAIKKFIQE